MLHPWLQQQAGHNLPAFLVRKAEVCCRAHLHHWAPHRLLGLRQAVVVPVDVPAVAALLQLLKVVAASQQPLQQQPRKYVG
jgi:hypothetical protein